MKLVNWIKKKIASVRKKQSKSVVLKIDGKELAKAVQKSTRDTTQEDGCSS